MKIFDIYIYTIYYRCVSIVYFLYTVLSAVRFKFKFELRVNVFHVDVLDRSENRFDSCLCLSFECFLSQAERRVWRVRS